jgi:hypothetical protein
MYLLVLSLDHCHIDIFQVAKALGASHGTSQGALPELFQHIEKFFRRLGTYTRVPPTLQMKEIMVKVIAEVLSVLAIATKELEQGKASQSIIGDGRPPSRLAYVS